MPFVATRASRRRRPLFLTLAVLFLGAAVAPRVDAAAPSWSVEITPDGELFPVLDLSQRPPRSTAAPGGGNGLVIVRVRGDDQPRHLSLEVSTPGLRAPARVEADLGRHGTIELRPRLEWDTEYLHALRTTSHQSLRVSLAGGGPRVESRNVDVRVHPLDDALYFVREGKDRIDLGWVFAAYVNPQDPVVDEIAADARELDEDFDRRATSADDRLRRVLSIWTTLVRHGLRYAAGDPALSRGPAIYSQRVRLLGDVWRERRANCLDGSVLIASVLERIGIPAFIALVPGHAFVGYRADADHVEFLETTLLGEETRARGAPEAIDDGLAVAANFEAARDAGRERWRRVSSRFERRHGPDYALIDIGAARSYGIIPFGPHGDGGQGGERTDPTAAGLPPENSPP
jgi:hypothetical protein